MDFGWLESIIFGFVSGLTEFLPISAQAHETLVMKLFGMESNALLRMIVHTAVWEALYLNLQDQIDSMKHERNLAEMPARRRNREPDMLKVLDLRLIYTAMIPMILGILAGPFVMDYRFDLSVCALLLVVNGVILYIPGHIRRGNKDSRTMTRLDGVLMGIFGAFGILPGISRMGALNTAAAMQGADQERGLDWSLLLSIPALMVFVGLDAYELLMFGAGEFDFGILLQCIIAAVAAFWGAKIGISIMRQLAVRTGFAGFAYYCWGAALFMFILYLSI